MTTLIIGVVQYALWETIIFPTITNILCVFYIPCMECSSGLPYVFQKLTSLLWVLYFTVINVHISGANGTRFATFTGGRAESTEQDLIAIFFHPKVLLLKSSF